MTIQDELQTTIDALVKKAKVFLPQMKVARPSLNVSKPLMLNQLKKIAGLIEV